MGETSTSLRTRDLEKRVHADWLERCGIWQGLEQLCSAIGAPNVAPYDEARRRAGALFQAELDRTLTFEDWVELYRQAPHLAGNRVKEFLAQRSKDELWELIDQGHDVILDDLTGRAFRAILVRPDCTPEDCWELYTHSPNTGYGTDALHRYATLTGC